MLASFPNPKCRRRSVRKPWKSTFSITPLSFDAPLQGTPANIRTNLILTETTVIALSLPLTVWVYLHSNFRGELRNRTYFETECEMVVRGHPRSLISVSIESAYATSYWSSIVTLVLSCPVSEMLQVFCSQQRPHTYSTRILRVFSLD